MIPLSVPNISGNEWKYVKECLDTSWVSSVGSYVDKLEEAAANFSQVEKAVATSNGTAALHISLIIAGVTSNDLVLLPNITFVAPANVIKYLGADPVFIDVDENTWQLDVNLVKEFLESHCEMIMDTCYHKDTKRRISAIIPVHVLGNMVDMEALIPLMENYNIAIIEDATEALGSTFNGKPAGSLGLLGCLSYNGNKIITSGGGGMILSNLDLAKKAKHLTTQAKADQIEYYHDEVGYNYRLVNILAAIGLAQMEQLNDFIAKKKSISFRYTEELIDIPGFRSQVVTPKVQSNCWLYTACFDKSKKLMNHLAQQNIQTRPFWIPMNQLPPFLGNIYFHKDNISEKVYTQCLSLPCSTNLLEEDQQEVINCIKKFYA